MYPTGRLRSGSKKASHWSRLLGRPTKEDLVEIDVRAPTTLTYYSFASGRVEWTVEIEGQTLAGGRSVAVGGLSVSPDGYRLLYCPVEINESDLVLVENPLSAP